ncbi:MAG: GlsB/YeaQ/YmgE family stress response membrane protein [Erysipelotrichaceae bacterium]|nr:GlsB/YeaQ/YmgE family stress response membrane protein [Erysipelotrichaceae bacterium]
MIGLLISLAVSGLAGYLAGNIMNLKGEWYVYVLLGLLGGIVGSVVFGLVGFASYSIISEAIVSVVGACLVVYIYRTFFKK